MYLAPLNYDRYFKKVFSEIKIAKRFLEDFLDIEIDELELLPGKHKITDNSTAVEFDFRCKIKDRFIIVDMQQWFKSDIVKRFYLYHSMNTVLQLEKMPEKNIDLSDNKKRDIKDYNKLIPVITLIWLVDDNMKFNTDFVCYSMTNDVLNEFIKNNNLWEKENIIKILAEREKCLEIINNRTRGLDFLQENKLIYAFQPNIIMNKKFSKYSNWFELAEKTRNKLNEKIWFDKYLKDDIFIEVIRRINTETLEESDWDYIKNQDEFIEEVKRYEDVFREEGRQEGILEIVRNGISAGYSNEVIKVLTNLSDKQIDDIRKELK